MTKVLFNIGQDTIYGVYGVDTLVTAKAATHRISGEILVTRNQLRESDSRPFTLDLAPTGLGQAWIITVSPDNGDSFSGYYKVPAGDTVNFTDLVEVDPESLEATDVPDPEWWAVANSTINSGKVVNDHLILIRNDGVEVDAGNVRGLPGQDGIDGDDGAPGEDGVNGAPGADGVSVVYTEINADGDLLVTLSDDQVVNAGRAKGRDADTSMFVLKGETVANAQHKIYVDSNSAGGDGTELSPFKSFAEAFSFLKNVEPVLQGYWEVIAAPGTYNVVGGGDSLTARSINRIVVAGSVDENNVPTTIIDGTGGANYSHGLRAGGVGVRVEFRNLKFINFNNGAGDTSRIGCVGENESDVYFNNIHADNCSWTGIYAFNTLRARITGGVINACRAGIVSNDSQCTVLDTVISNSLEDGIYWSRGSQGHVDYVTITDCPVGLRVAESSRVDTVGVNFKRNAYAVRTRTGGVFGEGGAANIYNIGTADANTVDKEYSANSGDSRELEKSQDSVRIASVRNSISHSVAGESLLSNIMNLSPNRLTGTGKELRVEVYGVFASVTADSRMYVDVGGSRATFVPKAGSNESFILTMNFLEATGGYRSFSKIEQGLNYSRISFGGSGFSRAVENPVNLLANLSSVGESLTIYKINAWVTG